LLLLPPPPPPPLLLVERQTERKSEKTEEPFGPERANKRTHPPRTYEQQLANEKNETGDDLNEWRPCRVAGPYRLYRWVAGPPQKYLKLIDEEGAQQRGPWTCAFCKVAMEPNYCRCKQCGCVRACVR
jgi:hypothetical protein